MPRKTCNLCRKGLNTGGNAATKCVTVDCNNWSHKFCLKSSDIEDSEFTCDSCRSEVSVPSVSCDSDCECGASSNSNNSTSEDSIEELKTPLDHLLERVNKLELSVNTYKRRIENLETTVKKHQTERKKMSSLEEEIKKLQAAIDIEKTPQINNGFSKNVIQMKPGNILEEAKWTSIAHCVGRDMLMEDGLAKKIKTTFKTDTEMLKSRAKLGGIEVQPNGNEYILHIVTKELSTTKPNWKIFKKAIVNLEAKCTELGIHHIAIPQIGCGLDGLQWHKVMKVLKSVFLNSTTQVTVVYLTDEEENKFRSEVNNKRLKLTKRRSKPTIEVIGDSQVRDLGMILTTTEKNYSKFVSVKPGATTKRICQDLNLQTAHLLPSDHLFLLAGTNDIQLINSEVQIIRNEEALLDYFSQGKHVNISVISTPPRFDNSILNTHIQERNIITKTMCQEHKVNYLDMSSAWQPEDFEGLHLNHQGKKKLAEAICEYANAYQNFL